MKQYKKKNPTILIHGVGIFIIITLCTLSLLDASEYVRCGHIGICEFLELAADLGTAQETKLIISNLGINKQNVSDHLNFYDWPQSLTPVTAMIPSLYKFTGLAYYLFRHLNPYAYCPKKLYSTLKKTQIIIDQKNDYPLISNSLPSQTLQIITTSIIKS